MSDLTGRIRLLLPLLVAAIAAVSVWCPRAIAQELSAPLRLADVVRIAEQRRAEIVAAVARASAAAQRPAIAGALEDPMIAPSIDHYPFHPMAEPDAYGRFDWTIAIEQRFPLSDIRTQRRRAAQADARRSEAEVDRVRLDVALEAQRAFFMLRERREMVRVLDEQLALARQLVVAASCPLCRRQRRSGRRAARGGRSRARAGREPFALGRYQCGGGHAQREPRTLGVAADSATRIPGARRRAAWRSERAVGCGRESA